MIRNVVGFAVFAGISILVLKLIFGLLGGIFAILGTLLWFAFLGWIFYTLLKIVAPDTARRVREMISGSSAA
jgi:hypothetical protein